MAPVNPTCSKLCGFIIFAFGIVYFLLLMCMAIYCYVPIPGLDTSQTIICISTVSVNDFIDTVTVVFVFLLVATGLLAIAASKLESHSVVVSLMISSTFTLFMSSVFVIEKTLSVLTLVLKSPLTSSNSYGNNVQQTKVTDPLVIDGLYLLCAAGGFFASLVCCFLSCKGVCSGAKVSPANS
ncbi:uncharacterized protein [Ptychodera flava]|uniref:uncharacterized protein n=1 Tax=Ptychodera flava TaxID=63121 RepID=UPI00396A518E